MTQKNIRPLSPGGNEYGGQHFAIANGLTLKTIEIIEFSRHVPMVTMAMEERLVGGQSIL